jgi:hypothetical protein
MIRPAKSATKTKWIAYADALEGGGDIVALARKVDELEQAVDVRRRHIRQLKRQLAVRS